MIISLVFALLRASRFVKVNVWEIDIAAARPTNVGRRRRKRRDRRR